MRGRTAGVLIVSTFLITAVGYLSTLSLKDQGSRLDCDRGCCVEKFCFGCDARLRSSVADRLSTSRYRQSTVRERLIERANVSVYICVSRDGFCLGGRGNQVGFLFSTIHLETRTGRHDGPEA